MKEDQEGLWEITVEAFWAILQAESSKAKGFSENRLIKNV